MSVNVDALNLTSGFFLGILSGLALEEVRYRHQKHLSVRQRLLPPIERMLGTVTSIRQDSDDAKSLDDWTKQYRDALGKTRRDAVLEEFVKAILVHSFNARRGFIEKSKEFEDVYSELTEKGMLETLGMLDKLMYQQIKMTHECTKNFSKEKFASVEDALEPGIGILTDNLVRESGNLEKSLRNFILR